MNDGRVYIPAVIPACFWRESGASAFRGFDSAKEKSLDDQPYGC